MEPLPATDRALDEMVGERDLREMLLAMGREVVRIIPSCVGLSLALLHEGLTFTLVASDKDAALVDTAQYLDGGPCVDAADEGSLIEVPDVLDERRWSMFAQATAAAGIRSSLSLPLREKGTVVGGINLYAAAPDAFVGRHHEVAEALGAWAEGAVADADLGFRTRQDAERAPSALADLRDIDLAIGLLAARWDLGIDRARARFERAARRAGVSLAEAARLVRRLHPPR